MREPNISYMSHNRPAICITSGVYDRRALDCTATVPLINSLTHLAYLTSTSPRIREILVSDGGLERLIQILSVFDLPNDRRHLWKWSLAFQCVVNVGVRGTEQIRTRVVQAGAVHVVMRVLENFLQGVENARQQHHRKRDTTALGYPMVLSPTDSRGYSTLFQLPPPADNIANILTAASPFTPPPSRSITTTNNNHVRTSTSISPSSTTLQKKHRIMRVHTMRRSTLPYVKMDPAQRRRNRLVRVPTTELEALRDPRNSSIDNLFYREEDILLSLQLLAYLSKYPHIRNVFHSAYSINVFSLVERFCCHRVHSSPVQYWAGVIMRNACRKDEGRGGIRRCAYMQCGRWEKHQREFAKCRRCRKAKYCSKACQSKAWADGHRWWCIERQDHTNPTTTTTTATTTTTTTTATITAGNATTTTTTTTNGSNTTATAASAATTTAAAAMHAPRRQQSRGLSPSPAHNGAIRSVSPSPIDANSENQQVKAANTKSIAAAAATAPTPPPPARTRSPTAIVPSNDNTKLPSRRSSTADMPENRVKSSVVDNTRKAELLNKIPRPTSMHQFGTPARVRSRSGGSGEHSDEEKLKILRDEDGIQEEILQGLIKELRIPLASLQNQASKKEILFPAHMIGMTVTEMWRASRIQESERMLFSIMDTIQKKCLNFTGDQAIMPCGFWLSNVHELLSVICQSERELEQEWLTRNKASTWHDFEKLVSTVKFELQCLEDNIFHAWMKELKKRISKMVIPAIIEGQSLPGFVTSDSNRFFNKLLTGSSQPSCTMDDILNVLTKVWRTLKCYYLEPSISSQVLTELLKLIGVTAFNDLLMRKNFSSWKRAMQIQYNVTRIEEWCKSHDIPEGTLQLEHLMQATKLLQVKKSSLEDIEQIYETCWILSPTQIQKFISQYQVADYENPVGQDILKAVATHVAGDKSDVLLLDSVSLDDTSNPFEIPVPREVESQFYLPAWLNLKRLRQLALLVQYQYDQQHAVDSTAVASP